MWDLPRRQRRVDLQRRVARRCPERIWCRNFRAPLRGDLSRWPQGGCRSVRVVRWLQVHGLVGQQLHPWFGNLCGPRRPLVQGPVERFGHARWWHVCVERRPRIHWRVRLRQEAWFRLVHLARRPQVHRILEEWSAAWGWRDGFRERIRGQMSMGGWSEERYRHDRDPEFRVVKGEEQECIETVQSSLLERRTFGCKLVNRTQHNQKSHRLEVPDLMGAFAVEFPWWQPLDKLQHDNQVRHAMGMWHVYSVAPSALNCFSRGRVPAGSSQI
mmetsp:Transcript_91758/g.296861  ORF Transcript_91758/g.296861 Transcript_91758/m.296861 type:complete len:271 (-) Transcript_91758:250-1062(-)